MPKDLRVSIVQTNLYWEDAGKNIRNLNKQLKKIFAGSTDLIVLPEMFNSGFTMNAGQVSEAEGGLTMQWMRDTASSLKTAICGSLIIKEKDNFYNRFMWINPDGSFQFYNKKHLFRMGGEDKIFTPGKENIIIDYKGWKIRPQVCYDLRFPVWSRNRMEGSGNNIKYHYDVLLYVANWPAVRSFAWQQLLIARAIENQSYVVAVNRVGIDGKENSYNGGSVILDPSGGKLNTISKNKFFIETILLSAKDLENIRKKFPVFYDADAFTLLCTSKK